MATSAGFFHRHDLLETANLKLVKTGADLREVTEKNEKPVPCTCAIGRCAGWESLAEYRWEGRQMTQVATLRAPELDEPTLEELHPKGTRYDSHDAPVAVGFFPYNRCDVWHCRMCHRHLLRYTEFGGYNVDHRIRALDHHDIVD
jgi:hypothetical protein